MDKADSASLRRFAYYTDPSRRNRMLAIGGCIVLVVLATLPASPLLRLIFLAGAAGPALWLLLEWRRQGRGVWLEDDHVAIQGTILKRTRKISYADVHTHVVTERGSVIIAFKKPIPAEMSAAATTGNAVPLTQMRPVKHTPRPGFLTTYRLADPAGFNSELTRRLESSSARAESLPPELLFTWADRRRLRNFILFTVIFLATPVWVIILLQILFSFMRLGGNSIGR